MTSAFTAHGLSRAASLCMCGHTVHTLHSQGCAMAIIEAFCCSDRHCGRCGGCEESPELAPAARSFPAFR